MSVGEERDQGTRSKSLLQINGKRRAQKKQRLLLKSGKRRTSDSREIKAGYCPERGGKRDGVLNQKSLREVEYGKEPREQKLSVRPTSCKKGGKQ